MTKTTSSKTQNSKPETQNSDAPAQGALDDWAATAAKVANISQLHDVTGFDRATIRQRLEAAGLKPVRDGEKLKQYDEKRALEILLGQPRQPVPLTHARTQKTQAEAARILLKLKREQGDLVPIGEMREEAFNVVKAIHTRFMRYARESRTRLVKIKNAAEMERTIATDFALIFDDLKRDYPNVL